MNPMETDDIVLRKAKFEDWESMHQKCLVKTGNSQIYAMANNQNRRISKEKKRKPSLIKRRMIHTSYTKKNMVRLLALPGLRKYLPHIFQDAGIALVPEYTGKGLGKQTLQLLLGRPRQYFGRKRVFFIL